MKLKTSFLYQIKDLKNTIITFYSIYFAVLILLFTTLPVLISSSEETSSTLTGMEAVTCIFLIIAVIGIFKEHLLMLLQNGISRKSYFIGRLLTFASLAIIMSILETIFFYFYKLVTTKVLNGFICYSLYEITYTSHITSKDTFLNLLEGTTFHLFVYFMIMTGSFLVSILFYRLSKSLRIAFGAGIPIFIFCIFPIFDYSVFQGKISNAIADFINFLFGVTANQPLRGILTLVISSLLFSFLSWIGMRKISIKE